MPETTATPTPTWDSLANPAAPLDLAPRSTYEVVTRQMVMTLQRDLEEIKSRLNSLMAMVAGAVVVDIILRLATP